MWKTEDIELLSKSAFTSKFEIILRLAKYKDWAQAAEFGGHSVRYDLI